MPPWLPLALHQVIQRVARLSPACHRELVRGMVAELDSIPDPAEQTRFALGAVAAIARLTLREYTRTTVRAPGRLVGITNQRVDTRPGGLSMPALTTRQLLRRHASAFVVSFVSLTGLLLANHAVQQVPRLSARGAPAREIAEVLLLGLPFTIALTIPMAVFMAVSWVFTRLGAEGVLASARTERHGFRRLLVPVSGAAAVVATLTLVSNTLVVPRANARLAEVIAGTPRALTDRTMTISELREAAQEARTSTRVDGAARAAAYEVEIQKKIALAAACMILALAGAVTALRFPRGGVGLVLGASAAVFTGYYLVIVAGEALADRQVVSPLVAMWTANAFLLSVVLVLVWRPGHTGPNPEAETLVIGR